MNQNFQTGRKMGTMAFTQYIPQHKGFHDLHKWTRGFTPHACGFCTMGTWIFNTMVKSGRPKKTCPLYLCKRTKRRQKRTYENNYSFSIHQSSLVYLVVLKAVPVHNLWMDFQIQKKYPSFLIQESAPGRISLLQPIHWH